MIKVNLLPVKRKKKAKPVPTFLIATVLITLVSIIVIGYLMFFFSSRLSEKKQQFAANEKKIAELKEKIKAVDDFEKRNKTFKERNDIIEQLSRNKSLPVKLLAEVNSLIPSGIWLQAMAITGDTISIDGYGFSNAEIVNYVDNLKNSALFTEVYLQESKSGEMDKIPLYIFKMTFKIKG
jgi:type IV pilus assembly protein PilN